jgi:hypothetical protein
MIDDDLSDDQKSILISTMLEVQESGNIIQDLKAKLDVISLSATRTDLQRVAVLRAGDSFGELALIDSRRGVRAASITCLEPCRMAVINAEDYHRSLAKIEKKKRNMLIEFLCAMPYFKAMHRIYINKLINSFSSVTFQRGQYVQKEGLMHRAAKETKDMKTAALEAAPLQPKEAKIDSEEDDDADDEKVRSPTKVEKV